MTAKIRFNDKIVKQIMSTEVIAAGADTTVFEAVKTLRDKNIGAILVIEKSKLIGIFTERDASFKVVAEGLDYKTVHIGEVMTKPVVTVKPDTSIEDAFIKTLTRNFRHLPVLNEEEKVIGLVSMKDLLAEVLQDLLPL